MCYTSQIYFQVMYRATWFFVLSLGRGGEFSENTRTELKTTLVALIQYTQHA
jgi:hypothetical protein